MPSVQLRRLSKEETDGNQVSLGQKNTALNTQGARIPRAHDQKWGSKRTEEQGTFTLIPIDLVQKMCPPCCHYLGAKASQLARLLTTAFDTIRMQTILVDILV